MRYIMQQNLIWKGIEYHSLENCIVDSGEKGIMVQSTIAGYYEGDIYKVDYLLHANPQWETERVEVTCQLRNVIDKISLRSAMKGKWWLDDEPAPQFDGCTDVDITLTCFTNSLPINRLDFGSGESHQIKVVYIDILENSVTPTSQKYTRINSHTYKFENVPNDFEALIETDGSGLVVFYPELFERTIILNSNYKL